MGFKLNLYDVEPLQDRLLVRQLRDEELQEEGSVPYIIAPDDVKEKPLVGEVIAIGPGRHVEGGLFVPVSCMVGDFVLFGRFTGVDIPDLTESDTIKIMREDEIFARVRKPS